MTVTEIQELSKRKCIIYLDGQPTFSLYKGELAAYRIKADKELSSETYNEIVTSVLTKRARLRVMNLLKSKAYTEAELVKKLKQSFYPEVVINEALDYVKSFRYVDDMVYAEDFIKYRAETESKKQIVNKLLLKGITKEMIEEAFRACEAEGTLIEEERQIRSFLEKKHYSPDNCLFEDKQKLFAALYRKGFSTSCINRVMKSDFYLT